MLEKLAEHYRIVNPNPSDAVIVQRRKAIESFLTNVPDAETWYTCAEIALTGLRPTPSEAQLAVSNKLIAAISNEQPSFSGDPSMNALDLRVCAGIALGERIQKQGAGEPDIAGLVLATSANRPAQDERHLEFFVLALLDAAKTCLSDAGRQRRERPTLDITVQGADAPSLAKSVNRALQHMLSALKSDQEELQILWWVLGKRSLTAQKLFAEVDVPIRVILAAAELADQSLLPPMANADQFLRSVIEAKTQMSVQQFVELSDRPTLASATRHAQEIASLIQRLPATLPMTWLFMRRIDSDLAPGWETEFEQKTRLSKDFTLTASAWAQQIFNECIAARLIAARLPK